MSLGPDPASRDLFTASSRSLKNLGGCWPSSRSSGGVYSLIFF